jgi:hypothetical protein
MASGRASVFSLLAEAEALRLLHHPSGTLDYLVAAWMSLDSFMI